MKKHDALDLLQNNPGLGQGYRQNKTGYELINVLDR